MSTENFKKRGESSTAWCSWNLILNSLWNWCDGIRFSRIDRGFADGRLAPNFSSQWSGSLCACVLPADMQPYSVQTMSFSCGMHFRLTSNMTSTRWNSTIDGEFVNRECIIHPPNSRRQMQSLVQHFRKEQLMIHTAITNICRLLPPAIIGLSFLALHCPFLLEANVIISNVINICRQAQAGEHDRASPCFPFSPAPFSPLNFHDFRLNNNMLDN